MNNYGPPPESLSFGDAIGTCFKKYFVFEGRASKSEYWYFVFFIILFDVVVGTIGYAIMSVPIIMIFNIFTLITLIPWISAGCRRIHDVGKSGWFQVIPIYNLILWLQDSTEGSGTIRSSQNKSFSKTSYLKSKNKDLTDDLEELQELYEDGTLSEAQFKKAKKKLLK